MSNFIEKIKRFLIKHKRIFLLLFLYFNLFIFASTIMIIVRTRPAGKTTVPSLTGEKYTFVYNLIERNSLKPELKYEDVSDIEDGVILSQDPESGEVVSKNSRITLVVSRNELKVEVPSLIGSPLTSARTKLLNLHTGQRTVSLLTGVVTYVPSDKPEGIVLQQSPAAGEKVPHSLRVNMLVSSGSASDVKMPDVKGQSIDLVYDLLISKGCTVEQEIVNVDSPEASGRIIEQSINAGDAVSSGTLVKLKVAYFPITEHLYNAYELLKYEMKKGDMSLVEAFVEDDFGKRMCFSANIEGGKEISFVFARQGNARVSILRNKKLVTVMSVRMTQF
ncbi:MAG: PASTA domain-containing protein [Spirochaetes bacterium]|nr:PASTA domain-containing protein [Spirochaetota bacterium]